jgi:hypothetical protein
MKLKYKYEKQADVPQEVTQLYSEQNGAYLLNVEGAVDRTKLDEFQKEKISLLNQLDEVKRRYEGIDPEAVRKLEAEKQKLEEQQALKAGEVERVIESRLKSFQTVHEKQVKDLASERDALIARLSEIQIDQGVVGVATKKGLHPTAIPDITARARRVFRLVNGEPTPYEPDGKTVKIGKDGANPMSLDEWLDQQAAEAPHLFESDHGQYSQDVKSKTAVPNTNPFRKATWNMTDQVLLMKSNPGLAERMKKEALGQG